MKLYDRDYTELNPKEDAEWHSLKEKESGKIGDLFVTRSRFREYPKAARHYVQLFPNNYLDIVELKDCERLRRQVARFRSVLNTDHVSERRLCKFISASVPTLLSAHC